MFDPVSWGVGFVANRATNLLLSKVFDVGALGEIRAAAEKWSAGLPENIRTPSHALFEVGNDEDDLESKSKLKQSLLELHKVPTAEEWFDALIEAWEHKRDELGADANAFFKLERSAAEDYLRRLAEAIFGACASSLKYSQPLLVNAVRELGVTQSLILTELRSFRGPLNNPGTEPQGAIKLNFDPTKIQESELHLLNEVICVDSPAESIAGKYRTHEIWVGPDGCTKENASYVPLGAPYVESKFRGLLAQWNRAAIDLAKQDPVSVISALASFHHKFLEIHPYPDGNGRVARAVLDLQVRNFTLMRSPLKLKSRPGYYLALNAADRGNIGRLRSLIASTLKQHLGDWDAGSRVRGSYD